MMMTESATQALSILRDGSLFQWYLIPIFALVVYVYAVEIERRNWNLVFAGLAFWGMEVRAKAATVGVIFSIAILALAVFLPLGWV
jgi:hypothetical protein